MQHPMYNNSDFDEIFLRHGNLAVVPLNVKLGLRLSKSHVN